MTLDDHEALVAIGRRMAATNGYKPEQASDLYITSGTTRDFEYGMYRIFAYTFEMSVGDYPDDALIPSETGRNKEAVLYLIERAGCPSPSSAPRSGSPAAAPSTTTSRSPRLAGQRRRHRYRDRRRVAARRPAADDDVGGPRSSPAASRRGGTGSSPGSAAGTSAERERPRRRTDLGRRRRRSTLPATADQKLQFRWTFAHDATARSRRRAPGRGPRHRDGHGDDGPPRPGAAVERNASWNLASIDLTAWAGKTIRLRFSATDAGTNGIVEAGFDDVRVTQPQ